MELGDRIAAWRDVRGLNQKQLAETVPCSRALICQVESGVKKVGKKKVPARLSMPMLESIVAALDLTMSEFYGPIPKPKKKRAAA